MNSPDTSIEAPASPQPLILLTGATGYVGGRLLAELQSQHRGVRCLARNPEYLRTHSAADTLVVQGDVNDLASLDRALTGVHTAYYLVHSLGAGHDFDQIEEQGAVNFAQAAQRAGVKRIIYLGGLGEHPQTSRHLSSRRRVGELLQSTGVLTVEFRASMIIGSGSVSFELIRALARKLPVMVAPRWTRTLAQPVAIEDVIAYLVAALDQPVTSHRIYEIAGPDRVCYTDLMREYARQRGLRRWIIPVPLVTPWLSSLWLGLVTPVYARIGRKLIESTETSMLMTDDAALRDFPQIHPRGVTQAIERALVFEDQQFAATRWNDTPSAIGTRASYGGKQLGSRIIDSRSCEAPVNAARMFASIQRLGGKRGYGFGDALWRLRGYMDIAVGGVGLRRGRRDPNHLSIGDAVDFWRVEAIEPGRLLRLRAEMKVPGRAWLQYDVKPIDDHRCQLTQTALFDPQGLMGLAYWFALWPVHAVMFRGMLRGQVRAAVQMEASS